jgi:hypothetical protein
MIYTRLASDPTTPLFHILVDEAALLTQDSEGLVDWMDVDLAWAECIPHLMIHCLAVKMGKELEGPLLHHLGQDMIPLDLEIHT